MRARMRRGVAAVLTVSALSLTAAACGGSDSGSGSDGDKKAKETAAKPLTAAQMKAGLVGVKDLPAGYKVGEETADDEKYTADKKECQPLADFLSQKIAGGTDGGSADFESADQSSMLAQSIVTFPGAGATDYTKKLSTALDACKGFGVGEGDQKMAMTIEKLSATPKAGEESHSFRMKTEIKSLSLKFETNFQVVRQGTGISRVLHVPADASGHKDFDDLAKRVGEKFVKAVQS